LKKKYLDPYFLKSVIHSEAVWRELWHRTLHIAFPKKINMNEIKKVSVDFPLDIDEQTAIGDFFRNLDDTIALKKQEHEKSTNIKKAMLEKMFPKKGATVPELRFEGFNGEWKRRLLKDMTMYKNGKGHEDKQSAQGKYELINLNSVSINGGLKHSGKFVDDTDETLLKNDLVMVLSDVGHGDLLGRVALIPESNRFVLNQRVALLRPNKGENSLFLFVFINAHQKYFKSKGEGMSQLNISKGNVENFEAYFPNNLNEQAAIGNFFCNLDTLIAAQQEELEKLQNIKKACLSKMFV
jgi:type I restriction enzyme S subunit